MTATGVLKWDFGYKWQLYGKCRSEHKIWWKSFQKWLGYTCLCIFNMRSSAILESSFPNFGPPTTSHFVGYIFPVSGVVIWSDLADISFFRICWFGWKMPIHAPFGRLFEGFDPKSGHILLRPQKALMVAKTCRIRIASKMWSVTLVKEGIDILILKIHTETLFMHAQSRNNWNYSNEIFHVESLAGWSDIFEMASILLERFARGGGAKFCFSCWL